jgi:hypothetical protein
VLLDGQFGRVEIDLLDDQGLLAVEAELSATAGTAVQGVNQEKVDLLSSEQGAFVPGMARLATGFAFILSSSQRRLWLDDVRGRWFGGSGRVFAGGGELLLQTSHGRLQLLELCTLLLELRSQLLAPGTGIRRCFCHARVLFLACLIAQLWA